MTLDREHFFRERSFSEALASAQHVAVASFDHRHAAASLEEVVCQIEQLPADHVLLLERGLTPSNYRSPVNHLKRGKVVALPRYDNDAVGPTRLRQHVIQQTPLDLYVGYSFMSPNNQEANRVLLATCIEAARRFILSKCSSDQHDHITVKKIYSSKEESQLVGHAAEVEVPSRSDPKKRYAFRLTGLPLDHHNHYLLWRRIASEGHTGGEKTGRRHSGCEWKHFGNLTFRRPRVNLWCPHEQAAYMAITEQTHGEKGRVIVQPFALPSKRAVQFDTSLRQQVFVRSLRRTPRGKTVARYRPLQLNEREILHWGHVLLHRNVNIFYARNMLQYEVW